MDAIAPRAARFTSSRRPSASFRSGTAAAVPQRPRAWAAAAATGGSCLRRASSRAGSAEASPMAPSASAAATAMRPWVNESTSTMAGTSAAPSAASTPSVATAVSRRPVRTDSERTQRACARSKPGPRARTAPAPTASSIVVSDASACRQGSPAGPNARAACRRIAGSTSRVPASRPSRVSGRKGASSTSAAIAFALTPDSGSCAAIPARRASGCAGVSRRCPSSSSARTVSTREGLRAAECFTSSRGQDAGADSVTWSPVRNTDRTQRARLRARAVPGRGRGGSRGA